MGCKNFLKIMQKYVDYVQANLHWLRDIYRLWGRGVIYASIIVLCHQSKSCQNGKFFCFPVCINFHLFPGILAIKLFTALSIYQSTTNYEFLIIFHPDF